MGLHRKKQGEHWYLERGVRLRKIPGRRASSVKVIMPDTATAPDHCEDGITRTWRHGRTSGKGLAPTRARRLCGVAVPEFTIRPMTAADAHAVAAWRYPGFTTPTPTLMTWPSCWIQPDGGSSTLPPTR